MRHMAVVAVIVVICCSVIWCASGYQIALQETDLRNDAQVDSLFRQKRQVETFGDEDMSAALSEPEETGFWDRVVQVAIKIFARFVEWLNS